MRKLAHSKEEILEEVVVNSIFKEEVHLEWVSLGQHMVISKGHRSGVELHMVGYLEVEDSMELSCLEDINTTVVISKGFVAKPSPTGDVLLTYSDLIINFINLLHI